MKIFNCYKGLYIKQLALISALCSPISALAIPVKANPKVQTRVIQMSDYTEMVVMPGQTLAKVRATLRAEVDGRVTKLPVGLGALVQKGQKAAEIQQSDPVYRFVPTVLTSPVAGIVAELFVSVGADVARGEALLTVFDPSKLSVVAYPPAIDLPRLAAGQKAVFEVPSLNAKFSLNLKGVGGALDPTSGTATCEFEWAETNPDALKLLVPGLSGKIRVETAKRSGLFVPEEALLSIGQKTHLRVLNKKGRVDFTPITTGARRNGSVEVLEGLQPGSEVILASSRFISKGEKVEKSK